MLYDSFFGSENNISVATCGHSISMAQMNFIKYYCGDLNEVIIAYDKQFKSIDDEDFKKDKKLLQSLAKKFSKESISSIVFDKFNLIDYKDSPIDKGKEVFEHLFQNRVIQGVESEWKSN